MSFFLLEELGITTSEFMDAEQIEEEVIAELENNDFYNVEVTDFWEDPAIGGWRINIDVDNDGYERSDAEDLKELIYDIFSAQNDSTIILVDKSFNIIAED